MSPIEGSVHQNGVPIATLEKMEVKYRLSENHTVESKLEIGEAVVLVRVWVERECQERLGTTRRITMSFQAHDKRIMYTLTLSCLSRLKGWKTGA